MKDAYQNTQVEAALLGAVIVEWERNSAALFAIITDKDVFASPLHQSVFECYQEAFGAHQTLDQTTLRHALTERGWRDAGARALALADAGMESIGNAKAIGDYAKIVLELWRKRKVAAVIKGELVHAIDDSTSAVMSCVQKIVHICTDSDNVSLNTSRDAQAMIERARQDVDKGNARVLSGFAGIDGLSPLRPGNLFILAARAGIGKTTFALNIAVQAARAGAAVHFFSFEMTSEEITRRMLAMLYALSHGALERDDPSAWRYAREQADDLSTLDIEITDGRQRTIAEIQALARPLSITAKPALLVIDYLQLIKSTNTRNAYERVSEIARGLKDMAQDMRVPVLALSQLNRVAERKKPTLADLRDSGEIEQAANVVMLLDRSRTREEADERDRPDWGCVVLEVAKNRSGKTGGDIFDFNFDHQIFS